MCLLSSSVEKYAYQPVAAAFSARGVTKEGIVEATKEDYGELMQDQSAWRG
jgi:hypothetical protein